MITTPSKFRPFMLVQKDETKKTIITAGNYQVCDQEFDNAQQAEKFLASQPYVMCINLISILLYENEKTKQSDQKDKKVVAKKA